MIQEEPQTRPDELLYIPGLTHPSLFQELPPLTGFQRLLPQELAQEVYQEQRHQHSELSSSSLAQLAASGSWRALAIQAQRHIVGSDPSHTGVILQTWQYRFEALYELRRPRIIAREMLGLFTTIAQTFPLNEILLNLSPDTQLPSSLSKADAARRPRKALPDIVPFHILLLRARLPSLLHPHQHLPLVKTSDALFELLEGCKRMTAYHHLYHQDAVATPQKELWKERTKEVVGHLASLFSGHGFQPDGNVEAAGGGGGGGTRAGGKAYVPDRQLSIDLVRSLAEEEEGGAGRGKWREMEAKLWLELGALQQADPLLTSLPPNHPLHLVRALVEGQLDDAAARFLPLATASLEQDPPNFSLVNNLAIALLYSGKLSQSFAIMQSLMAKMGPSIAGRAARELEEEEEEEAGVSATTGTEWYRAAGPMNGLILNYATWIELTSGSDSERRKRDFLVQLLQSASSSSSSPQDQDQDQDQEQTRIENPIHRIADMLALHSFKLPASYSQSEA
ncbi:hypothetical protein PCANC_14447 [Puccinia coronata f. sp. avenae]|uniref:Uncharacterized protein n=1 Tax=Puccinia coronata f. sp. avenae TaxID=200324 RepID=A0A2N5USI6_9BASI|nr:hypothetical protein PCANC_14447 [Puccinia coronata f. sp. avenae]